jgi:hypothetical protein
LVVGTEKKTVDALKIDTKNATTDVPTVAVKDDKER